MPGGADVARGAVAPEAAAHPTKHGMHAHTGRAPKHVRAGGPTGGVRPRTEGTAGDRRSSRGRPDILVG